MRTLIALGELRGRWRGSNAKVSVVMFGPKTISLADDASSRSAIPRARRAARRRSRGWCGTRRRGWRWCGPGNGSMASMTRCGTWVPPGPSKKTAVRRRPRSPGPEIGCGEVKGRCRACRDLLESDAAEQRKHRPPAAILPAFGKDGKLAAGELSPASHPLVYSHAPISRRVYQLWRPKMPSFHSSGGPGGSRHRELLDRAPAESRSTSAWSSSATPTSTSAGQRAICF